MHAHARMQPCKPRAPCVRANHPQRTPLRSLPADHVGSPQAQHPHNTWTNSANDAVVLSVCARSPALIVLHSAAAQLIKSASARTCKACVETGAGEAPERESSSCPCLSVAHGFRELLVALARACAIDSVGTRQCMSTGAIFVSPSLKRRTTHARTHTTTIIEHACMAVTRVQTRACALECKCVGALCRLRTRSSQCCRRAPFSRRCH
jgi:hypothetical protein